MTDDCGRDSRLSLALEVWRASVTPLYSHSVAPDVLRVSMVGEERKGHGHLRDNVAEILSRIYG